jgi:uncharacterized protein
MDTEIRDNPDQRRYELFADGALAGFAAYRVRDGVTVVTHSEVDNAYRGKGLGSVLAGRTLDLLREQGARVVPACPFFARYVAEHPEYDDLIEK